MLERDLRRTEHKHQQDDREQDLHDKNGFVPELPLQFRQSQIFHLIEEAWNTRFLERGNSVVFQFLILRFHIL